MARKKRKLQHVIHTCVGRGNDLVGVETKKHQFRILDFKRPRLSPRVWFQLKGGRGGCSTEEGHTGKSDQRQGRPVFKGFSSQSTDSQNWDVAGLIWWSAATCVTVYICSLKCSSGQKSHPFSGGCTPTTAPPCLCMWAIGFHVLTMVPSHRVVFTLAQSAPLGLRRPAMDLTTTSPLNSNKYLNSWLRHSRQCAH